MLCEYGCGQEARFKLKNGKSSCSEKYQSCPELRRKNSTSGKESYLSGLRKPSEYTDESRYQQGSGHRGKIYNDRQTNIITLVRSGYKEYRCEKCGIIDWEDGVIVLELDHINGDHTDNRLENLRILCPNCHSQTPTFRNRRRDDTYITDDKIIESLKETNDIHFTMLKLSLFQSTQNFARVLAIFNKMKHKWL